MPESFAPVCIRQWPNHMHSHAACISRCREWWISGDVISGAGCFEESFQESCNSTDARISTEAAGIQKGHDGSESVCSLLSRFVAYKFVTECCLDSSQLLWRCTVELHCSDCTGALFFVSVHSETLWSIPHNWAFAQTIFHFSCICPSMQACFVIIIQLSIVQCCRLQHGV